MIRYFFSVLPRFFFFCSVPSPWLASGRAFFPFFLLFRRLSAAPGGSLSVGYSPLPPGVFSVILLLTSLARSPILEERWPRSFIRPPDFFVSLLSPPLKNAGLPVSFFQIPPFFLFLGLGEE